MNKDCEARIIEGKDGNPSIQIIDRSLPHPGKYIDRLKGSAFYRELFTDEGDEVYTRAFRPYPDDELVVIYSLHKDGKAGYELGDTAVIHSSLAYAGYQEDELEGYLKGKSALMVFDRHSNLKYKFGNRKFWAEGYYVSTVGLNEETMRKYIREQESADIAHDRVTGERNDPFEG